MCVLIQVFFLAFLVVYGILIVTQLHQYPFIREGKILEIVVLLYIVGIVFEEMLQASL